MHSFLYKALGLSKKKCFYYAARAQGKNEKMPQKNVKPRVPPLHSPPGWNRGKSQNQNATSEQESTAARWQRGGIDGSAVGSRRGRGCVLRRGLLLLEVMRLFCIAADVSAVAKGHSRAPSAGRDHGGHASVVTTSPHKFLRWNIGATARIQKRAGKRFCAGSGSCSIDNMVPMQHCDRTKHVASLLSVSQSTMRTSRLPEHVRPRSAHLNLQMLSVVTERGSVTRYSGTPRGVG